jgi:hypothetical protein
MYDGFCVVTKCGRLLNRFLPIEKADEIYKYNEAPLDQISGYVIS